ncbi:MAG TPA: glycosyltransferase family 4 protein [Planctomycetota bacterium]|nr:glycosyltransferase family 4 protein [Planctomycetota bacterium]
MRICILHPGMDVKGGAENIVVWLAGALSRRGHAVSIIAERYAPELWPQEQTGGLDVRLLPTPRLGNLFNSKQVRLWEYIRHLKKALAEFDAIVCQHFPSYYWATLARERSGGSYRVIWLCQEPMRKLHAKATDPHLLNYRDFTPPGVDNAHLDEAALGRVKRSPSQHQRDLRHIEWDHAAAAKCDMIVSNSAFTAENVQKIFGVQPVVCHLGIPLPDETPYTRGGYAGVITTLAVRKNAVNVIRAIDVLARRGRRDIPLRIAGRGPDRENLERLAANLGIADLVTFLGGIPDSDLAAFYRNARLIVYCPIDEPFGLVPLESLACKTPVVVSNHGGPAEIIEHGVTGLHANPFDPGDIAAAIEALWGDDARAQSMAEAGSRRVREYFSLEAFADRFDSILAAPAQTVR